MTALTTQVQVLLLSFHNIEKCLYLHTAAHIASLISLEFVIGKNMYGYSSE